ncbi:MAG: MBL fold metallo-hydrolase [Actinobacteria bacterium]|nr:MBL fold metallo-hydrolase [Actinomycetota bacterium]
MPDNAADPTMSEAAPPPVVTGEPQEIADGVFVIADGRVPLVPNVGIVVGTRAALVVDTGLGARSGATVRRIAEELAGGLPLFLTLTHFHPDHGSGPAAFGDATIVYNRTQKEEFAQKGAPFLQMFRGLSDEIAAELDGVEFVDPQIVYDGGADLDLGGKVVELRSMGPAHSRGDQSIFLPDERILFTGDLVENRFIPIFPPKDGDVNGDRWIAVVDQLAALEPATVVPGHGELGDAALVAITKEYLEMLRSESYRLADSGADPEAIVGELIGKVVADYPDWDLDETWRVATGVQTFLSQR